MTSAPVRGERILVNLIRKFLPCLGSCYIHNWEAAAKLARDRERVGDTAKRNSQQADKVWQAPQKKILQMDRKFPTLSTKYCELSSASALPISKQHCRPNRSIVGIISNLQQTGQAQW